MQTIRLENLNIWINFLKKIYGLSLLAIWAYFGYQCFLFYTINKDIFLRIINLEFLEDKTMIDPMILLGISCAKLIGIFIASLIIYSIIKKIFRAIPLPTSLINKWNNTNQISPMLAHRLISHYSYNTNLSFYELINIYKASQVEASILSHNFNNNNLSGLFKRFNPNLVNEIIIYNNYFPHMNIWQKIRTFFTGKAYRKPVLTVNTINETVNETVNENPISEKKETSLSNLSNVISDNLEKKSDVYISTINNDTPNNSFSSIEEYEKAEPINNSTVEINNPFLQKKSNTD